jgi:hypothetical protein
MRCMKLRIRAGMRYEVYEAEDQSRDEVGGA